VKFFRGSWIQSLTKICFFTSGYWSRCGDTNITAKEVRKARHTLIKIAKNGKNTARKIPNFCLQGNKKTLRLTQFFFYDGLVLKPK
jgi:hypothetical protein